MKNYTKNSISNVTVDTDHGRVHDCPNCQCSKARSKAITPQIKKMIVSPVKKNTEEEDANWAKSMSPPSFNVNSQYPINLSSNDKYKGYLQHASPHKKLSNPNKPQKLTPSSPPQPKKPQVLNSSLSTKNPQKSQHLSQEDQILA
jgi:hypothetical protein